MCYSNILTTKMNQLLVIKTVHLNHPCTAAHTLTRQQPHSARLQRFPQISEVALHSCTYHSQGSRRQCNATLIIIIRNIIQSSKVKRNWWKNLLLLHSQVFYMISILNLIIPKLKGGHTKSQRQ